MGATRVRPTNRATTTPTRRRKSEATTTPTDALQSCLAVPARLTVPLLGARPLPATPRSCAANRATPTPTDRGSVVPTRREATPTPTDALASRTAVTNRLTLPVGSLRPATPTLGRCCRRGCGAATLATSRSCCRGGCPATAPARRCGGSCGSAALAARRCGSGADEVPFRVPFPTPCGARLSAALH